MRQHLAIRRSGQRLPLQTVTHEDRKRSFSRSAAPHRDSRPDQEEHSSSRYAGKKSYAKHVQSAADLDSTNYMGGEFLPADYQNGFLSGDLQPESTGLEISSWQKDGQTITISMKSAVLSIEDKAVLEHLASLLSLGRHRDDAEHLLNRFESSLKVQYADRDQLVMVFLVGFGSYFFNNTIQPWMLVYGGQDFSLWGILEGLIARLIA